jgi:hypothetical protein
VASDEDIKLEPDDESRRTKDLQLLNDAVFDELKAINAFNRFEVSDDALRTFAWAVTTRIEHAFDVKWSPKWVRPGRPHVWQDNGSWHARCNQCLEESPASSSEQIAGNWFDEHYSLAHSDQAER